MRCHARYLRFAVLMGVPGLCIFLCIPRISAQTSPFALIHTTNGTETYININAVNNIEIKRSISRGAASSAPSATPAKNTRAVSAPPMIQRLVQKTSGRLQVDPKLVDAIIRVESAYDPRAVSSKGAMGLMQLVPATAQRFGVENPYDPRQNIRGGVTFLRYLLDRFNGNVPLSLAAYNAGEHRVERDSGIPAIPETASYVRRVTSLYHASRERMPAAAARDAASPIHHYVDSYGVVHFSND